jgi:hypothetical protein
VDEGILYLFLAVHLEIYNRRHLVWLHMNTVHYQISHTKINQHGGHYWPVSSIYIWNENSSLKSETKVTEIEELLDVRSRLFIVFACADGQELQGVCRNFVFLLRFKD